MSTCAVCIHSQKIQKDNSSQRKAYNVLCTKHGTVEPVFSFYLDKNKKERFGPIEPPDCFTACAYICAATFSCSKAQRAKKASWPFINSNAPKTSLTLEQIKKYVLKGVVKQQLNKNQGTLPMDKIFLVLTLIGAGVIMGVGMALTIWLLQAIGIILGG